MRENIELDELLDAINGDSIQRQHSFPTPLELAVRFDDQNTIGPDTRRRFVIESLLFGRLICSYTPGRAASETLAKNLSKRLSPKETLLCYSYALNVLSHRCCDYLSPTFCSIS